MKEASVSGALIIQPGNHLYDHSYVTSVLKAYPDKFVGMLLANPTDVSFPPCNKLNIFVPYLSDAKSAGNCRVYSA